MHALILACLLDCTPAEQLPEVSSADLERFPPAAVVDAQVAFAREHLAWLERVSSLSEYEGQRYAAWRQEARELLATWEALAGAQSGLYGDGDYQKEQLAALRELLGVSGYYSGAMPPAVPLWRFRIE